MIIKTQIISCFFLISKIVLVCFGGSTFRMKCRLITVIKYLIRELLIFPETCSLETSFVHFQAAFKVHVRPVHWAKHRALWWRFGPKKLQMVFALWPNVLCFRHKYLTYYARFLAFAGNFCPIKFVPRRRQNVLLFSWKKKPSIKMKKYNTRYEIKLKTH